MTIRLVGAGVGRTGTHSLKLALERLLGEPCYHMMEVFGRPDDLPVWRAATAGEPVDWHALFDGFGAEVDWPGSGFWPEISDAFPDAPVLLSTRESAEAWWRSADRTIFVGLRKGPDADNEEWYETVTGILRRHFTDDLGDPQACMAAYERHNAEVRATIPASRLVDWQPGDGWEPLAAALGVPVPDEPFPHSNSTDEFRTRAGYDE